MPLPDPCAGASWRSFVVVAAKHNPAGIGAPAGRLGMGAMHPQPRTWVDVQLAVDDDRIARMNGHLGGQFDVVVDLEHLPRARLHLKNFMVARIHGVVDHHRIERHFGAAAVVDHVLMQPLVVGSLATTARGKQCDRQRSGQNSHCANASANETRPSYNDLPRITPSAPAAATMRTSSTDEIPPEY